MKCSNCINCAVSVNKKTLKWYVNGCMKNKNNNYGECKDFDDYGKDMVKEINDK